MIGGNNEEPVNNISLENVEIITNGYIGSINIYSANGVVLDNVKIDDSTKGLINLHSSEVTIKSVNLPSNNSNIKAWNSIQINGHGGSPAHGKCKLTIENSDTIEFINQEGVYTSYDEYVFGSYDAQSEHEIIIKDGTYDVISPYNFPSEKHAGWRWYKKRSLLTLAYDFSKDSDVIEFDHGTNSVSYVDDHAQMNTLGAYAYYPFVPTVNDSVELTYNIVIKKPEENTKGYIDFNNKYVTSLHTIQGYIELIADSNNVTAKDSSNGSGGQHSAEDVTFDYNANSEVALTITAKFKYNKTKNEYSVDVSATDESKTLELGTRHATITTGDSVKALFMCLSNATDTNGSYIKNLEFKVVENN